MTDSDRISHLPRYAMPTLLLLLLACTPSAVTLPGTGADTAPDTGARDTAQDTGAGGGDTNPVGGDTGTGQDTGSGGTDTGSDTGTVPPDTGVGDTAPMDTGTVPPDTGTADSGIDWSSCSRATVEVTWDPAVGTSVCWGDTVTVTLTSGCLTGTHAAGTYYSYVVTTPADPDHVAPGDAWTFTTDADANVNDLYDGVSVTSDQETISNDVRWTNCSRGGRGR